MQLIYTYDRESAELLQEYLRGSINERVERGEITATMPSWIGDLAQAGLSAAASVTLAEAAIEEGSLDLTVSQVQARLAIYARATGDTTPTVEELLRWLQESGRGE
jgi:hypothetical protein